MNALDASRRKNAARAAFLAAITAGSNLQEAANLARVDMRTARLWTTPAARQLLADRMKNNRNTPDSYQQEQSR